MSEKERTILNKMAKLPEPLQDKFLYGLQVAAMTVETLKEVEHEPRKDGLPGHDGKPE